MVYLVEKWSQIKELISGYMYWWNPNSDRSSWTLLSALMGQCPNIVHLKLISSRMQACLRYHWIFTVYYAQLKESDSGPGF